MENCVVVVWQQQKKLLFIFSLSEVDPSADVKATQVMICGTKQLSAFAHTHSYGVAKSANPPPKDY